MVTVLMSVWNTPPAQLERAVNSILGQSLMRGLPGTALEFLILDDGSSDGATHEWLRQAAAGHPRIRLLFEPHRGLTATLNCGLALARGEFIARQDADDWSEPHRLERQFAHLWTHPGTVLLGTAAYTHQDDGSPLWPVRMPESPAGIRAALPHRNPFVHGSVMFRTAEARREGGYREELRCSQDYDFFWRLADRWDAANLGEPLYHYRYSAQSVSAGRAAEQACAHRAARILAGQRRRGEVEDVGRAVEAAGEGNQDVFRASLKQADHIMLAGRYRRAAREYLRLARSRPSAWIAWAKLARLGLFSIAPAAGQRCFR